MSVALLLLAVLPGDFGFDAYSKCATAAAVSFKDSTDPLDVLIGRVQESCATERSALLEAAPDKDQTQGWIRTTTALAVTGEVAALQSAPAQAQAPAPVVPDYPKLEAYRLCGVDHAAKTVAEVPNMTAEAVAAEAIATCEPLLKAAADETVEKMRQPSLRKQVISDFRRRATADLIQKIGTLRVSASEAAK